MSAHADDPLTRALAAFQSLRPPASDTVARGFWDQAHEAFQEVQREREALLGVAQGARGLVEAIDEYDEATETGEAGVIDRLGQACVEAEGALVDALYRLRAIQDGNDEEASQ